MEPAEAKQRERKHIFVVNSSPDFLEVVRELFQEEDYNVTTTNFIPETFEQIETLNPSLLIIDLAVGATSGWELLEQLGQDGSTRGIPIIIVSTNPIYLDEIRRNPDRFDGQHLLRKPFDLDEMLAKVDDLIGSAYQK